MKKFSSLFLLLAFFALSLSGQPATQLPQNVKESIEKRLEMGLNPAISIGLIDEKGVHYYNFGVKSMDSKDAVDENSIYEIGSISKTFTTIMLAQLVKDGQLKLEDPAQQYLPEGKTMPTRNDRSITLKELANHTSSIPRMPDNFAPADAQNPFADYTLDQLFKYLGSLELSRDIGSQYEYSNTAMGLLGNILAWKTDMTYEALMQKMITGPLNMENTAIALSPAMQEALAKGHMDGKMVSNWDIPTMAGAGAIRSNVVDMVKYVEANMGKTKSSLYPAMQLSHEVSTPTDMSPKVGLGWHYQSTPDGEVVWHNGGTGGYRAFAGFVQGSNRGVVVLTNSTESVDDIGLHLLSNSQALREFEETYDKEISDEVLDTYLGEYELAPNFTITVTRDGKQMIAQATGQQAFNIFPKSETRFFLRVVAAEIEFYKNDEGQVDRLTLFQGGQEVPGRKLK